MTRIRRWGGRYLLRPDGSVYDTIGGYGIDAGLWADRMRDNRSPYADHDFELGTTSRVIGDQPHWGRLVPAVCRLCGEQREVWYAVPMHSLNRGWCVDQSPTAVVRRGWRRWFGGARP